MNANDHPNRLSQISTAWTLLGEAKDKAADAEARAWAILIERYRSASHRYLIAAVRDQDIAAELFQEFAVRFLRGDLHRADQNKGRFRDYLKVCLSNLVSEHHRKTARHRTGGLDPAIEPAAPEAAPFESDETFLSEWRKDLLDRAWEALESSERQTRAPYFTALRVRTDQPEMTSAALAELMTTRLKPDVPFTDAGVRKLLQRAREVFTDLLVEEVASSVPTKERDRLEQELIDLGFFGYCRNALGRWKP
jgi:RNA polymerase sigma-70 factor (ECF subfamily)